MDESPEPAESEDGRTAFQRFEDLARKLVHVPKRDIDAERAKDDEKKQKP